MAVLHIDSRLKADFTWVLSGNALYSACQWAIVLVIAKLGSAAQLGEYALGMAVVAPIVLFANLQLRVLLASDVKDEFTFGEYLAFRLVSLGAALAAVAGVAVWMHAGSRITILIILVGVAQALEFLSETYYGWMQKHERLDRLSRSLMFKGPLALGALWAAMYATGSVLWAVLALALGRLAVLLAWDSRLGFAKKSFVSKQGGDAGLRLRWENGAMLRLLRLSIPLGVLSMLNSLTMTVPRYFLEAHRGSAELGIFSAIASLVTAGSLVVSAFGQSIFLPVARACATRDRSKFRGFVLQAVGLGGLLGGAAILVSALFGRQILTALFRPEYGEHADILVLVMAAGGVMFVGCGLGYVMTAARSLTAQIPLLLASVLAAAATSAWLIPGAGLRGAADALLVAAVVQLAGSAMVLRRIDRRLHSDDFSRLERSAQQAVEVTIS
jgi:O-antigen/teichoic acid export membrane protein